MSTPFELPPNPNVNLNQVYAIYAKRVVEDLEALIQTNLVDSPESERRKSNPKTGTGSLRSFAGANGLERSFSQGNTNNIYINNGTKTRYGSNIVYANIQEYGGNAGRNKSAKIPPRPYFRPAIAEWQAEFMLPFMLDLANAVADKLGIELE